MKSNEVEESKKIKRDEKIKGKSRKDQIRRKKEEKRGGRKAKSPKS